MITNQCKLRKLHNIRRLKKKSTELYYRIIKTKNKHIILIYSSLKLKLRDWDKWNSSHWVCCRASKREWFRENIILLIKT